MRDVTERGMDHVVILGLQAFNQLVAYHAHERRGFSFQIVEPVLWSQLVLDVLDIWILDFVCVELRFLYHYA